MPSELHARLREMADRIAGDHTRARRLEELAGHLEEDGQLQAALSARNGARMYRSNALVTTWERATLREASEAADQAI